MIKKFCLCCGKEFETQNSHFLFCSNKCKITRKKELKIISNKKYRQKIKDKLKRLETLEKELDIAKKEIARLQKELENTLQFIDMQYCERMKVKATKLPCGEREECWLNPKCKHNTLNEKPTFK